MTDRQKTMEISRVSVKNGNFWLRCLWIILLTLCCLQHVVTTSKWKSPDKALLWKLLNEYGSRSIRPVINSSDVVTVHFRVLIARLIDLDERKQQLTINGWMKQEWVDEFLRWDPRDYNGSKQLMIPTKEIWIPDITLYENVDGNFEHIKDIYAAVRYDGRVTWYAPVILVSSCKVKELYFPFDIQHCDMGFGSWSHDASQLMMVYPNDSDANQKVFTSNGVWELNGVEVRRKELKLACCKYPFIKIIYGLTLHRIPVFYIMNVVVPCILLSFLMLMVFCIPPESGEKISLGMSNLLAIILFQQLIAESLPPRGDEAPLIALYFFGMIIMGCVNIVGTVCVLRVYHTGGCRSVPLWLRCCKRLFNSSLFFVRNTRQTCRYSTVSSRDDGKLVTSGAFSSAVDSDDQATTDNNRLEIIQDGMTENIELNSLPLRANGTGNSPFETEMMSHRRGGSIPVPVKKHFNAKRRMNKKMDALQREEETAAEWRDIAVGLDRVLFLTLFTCMSAMLIYCAVSYISKFLQKGHHDEEDVTSIDF